jgi:hypothetical protein
VGNPRWYVTSRVPVGGVGRALTTAVLSACVSEPRSNM